MYVCEEHHGARKCAQRAVEMISMASFFFISVSRNSTYPRDFTARVFFYNKKIVLPFFLSPLLRVDDGQENSFLSVVIENEIYLRHNWRESVYSNVSWRHTSSIRVYTCVIKNSALRV